MTDQDTLQQEDAINLLTPRQREVWDLRYRGVKWKDVAKKMGCRINSAQRSFNLARKKMPDLPTGDRKPKSATEAIAMLKGAGLPPGMAVDLIKRLSVMDGSHLVVEAVSDAELVSRLGKKQAQLLGYMDDFVMAKSSLKDLAGAFNVVTDKRQLLRGEATSIVKVEDRRKLNELGDALLKEMQRRDLVEKERTVIDG